MMNHIYEMWDVVAESTIGDTYAVQEVIMSQNESQLVKYSYNDKGFCTGFELNYLPEVATLNYEMLPETPAPTAYKVPWDD